MALATNPEFIRIVVGAATKLPNGGLCWHEQGSYQTQAAGSAAADAGRP